MVLASSFTFYLKLGASCSLWLVMTVTRVRVKQHMMMGVCCHNQAHAVKSFLSNVWSLNLRASQSQSALNWKSKVNMSRMTLHANKFNNLITRAVRRLTMILNGFTLQWCCSDPQRQPSSHRKGSSQRQLLSKHLFVVRLYKKNLVVWHNGKVARPEEVK